ncbi:helix-turn-helix domain-containing protein [Bacillus halotolerans]|nr:helix-turn-helix domain-containing protein [Bacillus halotolerans]QVN28325.1 helix-turn-helix domain-containing protein [Bacillus halotolerans]
MTIYRLIRLVKLPCFKIGGSIRFDKSEIERYLGKGGERNDSKN